jgi:Putative Ig domain
MKGTALHTIRKIAATVAASVAVLGAGAAVAGAASASTSPLRVTLYSNGDSSASFNSTGQPVLEAGTDSGTSAQIQVDSPPATAPASSPTFTSTPASSAGDPRWVIEFHNGCYLFGDGTAANWDVEPGGAQAVSYATALADAEACGTDDSVTSAFIVLDAGDPGVPVTFSAVQYNGQTLSPGTVSFVNPGAQSFTVGTAVSLQLHANVSTSDKALTYAITGGGLPAGLSMSTSGLISGTPTTAQSYSVTVTATDAYGDAGSVTFTWGSVTPPPPATDVVKVTVPKSRVVVKAGKLFSVDAHATSSLGHDGWKWTVSSNHKIADLRVVGGVVKGRPKTGAYYVTVTATDTTGAHASVTFRVVAKG